jgi:1,4-alpha-glucan branching enzyme
VKRASLQSELKQRESVKAELQFDRERLKWADEKRKLQGQLRELIRVNDELEEKVAIDKHLSSVKRARPFSLRTLSGKSLAKMSST